MPRGFARLSPSVEPSLAGGNPWTPGGVVAGPVLRLYDQRWIPLTRPGDRAMPLRSVPFAVVILCASLLAVSLWPGKASRGQEPESKLPTPMARTITLQQDKIPLNNALQLLANRTKLPARNDLDEKFCPVGKELKGVIQRDLVLLQGDRS